MNRHCLLVTFLLLLLATVSAGLYQEVENMPEKMTDKFSSDMKNVMINFSLPLNESSKQLITKNIEIDNYKEHWQSIVRVISLFYTVMFLVIGLKFILGHSDESERAEAKKWLRNAFIVIVLVSGSFYLYGLIMELGNSLAISLWNSEIDNFFSVTSLSTLNFLWLGVFALSVFLAFMTLVIRMLFLIAGVVLFPLGLALFFTPPLREYGALAMNIIIVAVFMQSIDAIALNAAFLVSEEFSNIEGIQLLGQSLGYLFIFIVNSLLISFASLNAIGKSAKNIKVTLSNVAGQIKF